MEMMCDCYGTNLIKYTSESINLHGINQGSALPSHHVQKAVFQNVCWNSNATLLQSRLTRSSPTIVLLKGLWIKWPNGSRQTCAKSMEAEFSAQTIRYCRSQSNSFSHSTRSICVLRCTLLNYKENWPQYSGLLFYNNRCITRHMTQVSQWSWTSRIIQLGCLYL
jgi:hypothetical protein